MTDEQGSEANGQLSIDDRQLEQPDARRVLAHLTIDDLNALTKKELRELASAAGMPVRGRKPAILERLIAVKAGGDEGHVGGRTLCPSCKHIVMIVHTQVGQYRRGRCRHCGWRGKLPWK